MIADADQKGHCHVDLFNRAFQFEVLGTPRPEKCYCDGKPQNKL